MWLVIVLVLLCLVLGFLLGRFYVFQEQDAVHAWSVAGDVVRNTSGLFAVLAASIAAWVAYRTNLTRAQEANRSNFKDRLQWAAHNIETDNELEGLLADQLIDSMSQDESLSEPDLEIAQKVAKHREQQRRRNQKATQVYKKLWEERERELLHRTAYFDAETRAKNNELMREYRVLFMELGSYNEAKQYMLMADKLQQIIDLIDEHQERADEEAQ